MLQHNLLIPADNEPNIRTLNDVAAEYFALGLKDLSYQIWDNLYQKLEYHAASSSRLLPVISCNMGNMLRQAGDDKEAYNVLTKGLKGCFGSGCTYAMPELITQLFILWIKSGQKEPLCLPLNNLTEQNFILYFEKQDLEWISAYLNNHT